MELEHRFTVPAPIEVAWDAFNDLERIAPCFPGAALTSYDGDAFEGLVKVKLGPISLQYNGTGKFLERDADAHRAVIEARGKDRRGNGTAAASVTAQLTAAGDQTDVQVTTDLAVTGRPAQFGRGVMQDVSNKLLGQFASCLEQKLAADDEPADHEPADDESTGDEPAVDQPASGESAVDQSGATDRAAKDGGAKDGGAGDQGASDPGVGDPGGGDPGGGDQGDRSSGGGSTTGGQDVAEETPAVVGSPTRATETGRSTPAAVDPAAPGHRATAGTTKHGTTEHRTAEPAAAELDLGATVLPVLLKRYAPYLGGLLVVLVAVRLVRRRR